MAAKINYMLKSNLLTLRPLQKSKLMCHFFPFILPALKKIACRCCLKFCKRSSLRSQSGATGLLMLVRYSNVFFTYLYIGNQEQVLLVIPPSMT